MDEEPGINAFAAGYSPDDAVVAVTDGCLRRLTRDELLAYLADKKKRCSSSTLNTQVCALKYYYREVVRSYDYELNRRFVAEAGNER